MRNPCSHRLRYLAAMGLFALAAVHAFAAAEGPIPDPPLPERASASASAVPECSQTAIPGTGALTSLLAVPSSSDSMIEACFREFCQPGLRCTWVESRKNCCKYECIPDPSCTALECPPHAVCNPEGQDC